MSAILKHHVKYDIPLITTLRVIFFCAQLDSTTPMRAAIQRHSEKYLNRETGSVLDLMEFSTLRSHLYFIGYKQFH